MAEYTNLGLVKHVKAALKLNTMYMWGGILREITEKYIKKVSGIKGYERQYPESRKAELRKVIGKDYYGVDCVGLIKSYYWSRKADGGTGSPGYDDDYSKFPDVNAHMMYNAAKVKGPIATLPETPGIIVYSKTNPHVGVYIGNGEVIESTLGSRGDGVVKTKLSDWKGWEYWFKCPYITYKESVKTTVSRCKLAFPAVARSAPSKTAESKGRLVPGMWVTVIVGSDTVDEDTGKTYVKIARGGGYQWIVKSALEK